MASPFSIIGFNAGQSEKQSVENCINYIPYPTSQNDYNGGQVSLYSTTGIHGPLSSNVALINDGFDFLYSQPFTFNGVGVGNEGSAWAYWNGRLVQYSGSDVDVFSIGGLTTSRNSLNVRFSASREALVFVGNSNGSTMCQKLDAQTGVISAVDISPATGASAPGQNSNAFFADTAFYGDRFLYMSAAGPLTPALNGRVFFSGVNDPDIPNALSFIGINEDIGELRGIHVINFRLYVFSEKGIFVFTLNNSNTTPFIEQRGSRMDYGLISPSCKAELDNVLYFIGTSQGRIQLFRMAGGSVQKISNQAVDDILNEGGWWNGVGSGAYLARVFSFVDAGRSYVAFTFNGTTLCYDPKTGLFHPRESENSFVAGQWDISGSAAVTGVSIGDGEGQSMMIGMRVIRETNQTNQMLFNAGRVDKTIGTEFGQLVERTAISAPLNSNGVTNRLAEVQVTTDIDNDPLDPNWPEPTLNLSVSNDFGYSFKPEKSRKFGEQGVRTRLLRWLNLGIFRQAIVLKFRTKQPYAHQIIKVMGKFDKGFRQR